MALYVTAAAVKKRLAGKITFADDDTDDNAVGPEFLDEVIAESEAEVETRLSVRYAIPFAHKNGGSFSTLSQNTQTVIKSLIYAEFINRMVGYDFGRGTAIEGMKYAEQQYRVYEARMNRLVEVRSEQFNQFKYPPLEDLALAAHNDQADDGYAGRIYLSSDDYGDDAASQINDPDETLWNGEIPSRD